MADYVISGCTTADLTQEYFDKNKVNLIPFHFSISGTEYEEDFGKTISYDVFYKRMRDGEITKTSQVTAGEYISSFEKYLTEGKDILHVTLSSGLSGTYQSAVNAMKILKEKYPERKIIIIDSLLASSGYGLFLDKLVTLKKEGKDIDEVAKYAQENRLKFNAWFFSTDLSFYVRGGRIKKSSAFVASLLHICPVLNMNNKGELCPREKKITSKAAIKAVVDKMIERAENGVEYSEKVFISHSECEKFALDIKQKVLENFPNVKEENILIFPIGTTIGSHTGPGTAALFFIGKEREEK